MSNEKRRVAVSFESASRSASATRSLRLTRTSRSALTKVPVHRSPPEGAPDCYLQIWELDLYRNRLWAGDEEAQLDNRANRLLATVGGHVVRKPRLRFVAKLDTLELTSAANDDHGGVELELGGPEPVFVPFGEYEGVAELGAAVVVAREDPSYGEWTRAIPHRVFNTIPALRQQIARYGGLSVNFVADYEAKSASTNDLEFRRQAESMLGTRPTFTLDDSGLRFGYYEIDHFKRIAPSLDALRSAAQQSLGLADAPKIANLAISSHGFADRMAFTRHDRRPKVVFSRDRDIPGFAREVAPHLAPDCVVTLFACSTGRGGGFRKRNGKARRNTKAARAAYGRILPGEPLGADSFAWTLCRALEREPGIRSATVWGHTDPAHLSRNQRLRVFSSFGDADFVSLLGSRRVVASDYRNNYIRRLNSVSYNKRKPGPYFARLADQNRIRHVHYQCARYLPWQRLGLTKPAQTSGQATAAHECALLVEHFTKLAGGASDSDEGLDYDATGTYIRGPAKPGDLRVSENFRLSEFTQFEGALPLPICVVQGVQLLRYRLYEGLSIEGLDHGGPSGRLRFQLQSKHGGLFDTAKAIAELGLYFTHVEALGPNTIAVGLG